MLDNENVFIDLDVDNTKSIGYKYDMSSSRSDIYHKVIDNHLNLDDNIKQLLYGEDNKTVQFYIINLLFRDHSAELTNLLKSLFTINLRCQNLEKVLLRLESYKKYDSNEINKFGDVFTDTHVVKEMLDTLPSKVWSKPNKKWFNPANGMGTFTIEIILRLMNGLIEWEPDIKKRYKHIIENMIYVCELQPINMLIFMSLVDPNAEYNINMYCGSFIDNSFDVFVGQAWSVKFDMTVGNPPYNDSRQDNNRSKDIFQKFVTKSRMLSKNILMLTPARWFIKEYYLEDFRHNMVNDFNLKYLVRYDDNKYLSSVDVKGGFCYFLLTEHKNRKIKISNINKNIPSRPINIKQKDLVKFLDKHKVLPNFMDDRTFRLIRKIENYPNIEPLYNSARHFDIKTNSNMLKDKGTYRCFVSSRKGYVKYVDYVKENSKIDRYKLLIPAAANSGKMDEEYYTRMICAYPGDVCSESFNFFDFESEEEMISFKSYMETEFISFLIRSRKISQHLSETIFRWVPLVKYNKIWTNDEVYKYFKISKVDRKFIQKIVK